MNKTHSDEDLMLGYRNGDAAAFEVLYIRHKGALYRYLLRQCRIAAVAEELLRDVWLNLVRARERYEVRAKFTTYLFRLAHNRLIDYYRRQSTGLCRRPTRMKRCWKKYRTLRNRPPRRNSISSVRRRG